MIDRLTGGYDVNLRALFADLRYNLVVDSILDGNTPAWVYVDRIENPKFALLWNRQDALLLAGRATNAQDEHSLAARLYEEIAPNAKSRGIPQFSLHYTPLSWEHSIAALLMNFNWEKARRRFYTSSQLRIDWRAEMPLNCRMRRIDLPLLEEYSLENILSLRGWVDSFWHRTDDFTSRGVGFCLVDSHAVLSWCLSVYISGQHMEFGVATPPQFQRQGYATLVTAACVEYCLANGLTPHWHCWEQNRASIAVAQKVGFDKPMGYPVIRVEI